MTKGLVNEEENTNDAKREKKLKARNGGASREEGLGGFIISQSIEKVYEKL